MKIEKIVDVERMIEAANDCKSDMNKDLLQKVICSFDSYISSRKPPPKGKRHGYNYAFSFYILYKIASTVNSFVQLLILNRLLRDRSFLFGLDVLSKMWYRDSLFDWMIFPRDTICNISISEAEGIDHQYLVIIINLVFIICYHFIGWIFKSIIYFMVIFTTVSKTESPSTKNIY